MNARGGLMPVAAAASLIGSGAWLSIAGDESALRQLPLGNWIGGTIPYFMAEGGIFSMSDEAIEKNIKALSEVGIKATKDMFDTSLLAEI